MRYCHSSPLAVRLASKVPTSRTTEGFGTGPAQARLAVAGTCTDATCAVVWTLPVAGGGLRARPAKMPRWAKVGGVVAGVMGTMPAILFTLRAKPWIAGSAMGLRAPASAGWTSPMSAGMSCARLEGSSARISLFDAWTLEISDERSPRMGMTWLFPVKSRPSGRSMSMVRVKSLT